MKKLFVTLSLVAGAFFANAQDGMPVKGDYSLGIDATPFLTYVGGMLSNAGATAPNFTTGTPFTITGKYFSADNRAWVGTLGLTTGNSSTNAPNAADNTKTDETKASNFGLNVGVGYEYRRTKGRLVGVYGPYANLGTSSASTEFSDGNTTDGDAGSKTSGGNTFSLGLGAFVGAEYFFTKNISISGRLGLGLAYTSTSEAKTEFKDARGTVLTAGKGSNFTLGNTSASGLGLNLYF